MIISQTPFRISFFGGGTDFPEFYREHGGAVLATSINKYCYLSLHRLGPYFKHKVKCNYSKAEAVMHASEVQHPLFRECLLHLGVEDSLEISHIADLPGRTGIGSSSSFTVGLLCALHKLRGEEVTAEDLAREAIHIERIRVNDSGGHQDQYAAAYGGFIRLDFSGENSCAVRRVALRANRAHDLNEHLMLFYLGVEQSAETILSEQKKKTGQNIPALKEMLAMVDHAERILEGNASLNEFGDLLHESWTRKKTLSSGISNSQIDQAYEAARGAGARGGKLLGAGGRGFLLVFAEPEKHPAIRTALRGLEEVHFKFGSEGGRVIFDASE